MRKVMLAAAAAALCLSSVSPALAQDYRFSGFDAPRGATATANLRVPLGRDARGSKPSYGFSLGYGHVAGGPDLDGRTTTRQMKFADLRFTGAFKLQKAEVATFNLANLKQDKRMQLFGGGGSAVILVAVIGAGVAICLAADCFGDDDDNVDADVES